MTDQARPEEAAKAREVAHDMLSRAGFALKHTSPNGSRYYCLSARRGGLLRVADHPAKAASRDRVVSNLTIHEFTVPKDLEEAVARAIGRYVLGTKARKKEPKGVVNDHEDGEIEAGRGACRGRNALGPRHEAFADLRPR